jgi:hypothetical protein
MGEGGSKLDRDIEYLIEYLEGFIFEENDYKEEKLDDYSNYLRRAVFFVHTYIEAQLEELLFDYITDSKLNTLSEKVYGSLFKRAQAVLRQMDYYRKVEVAYEVKLISSKRREEMLYVNNSRNWFSHPRVFANKLAQLAKKKNIYEALDKITDLLLY